jgi:Domain of unknown function (DUF1918)
MEAQVGDELVVDSVHTGEEPRKGEILKIRVEDSRTHCLVRWDDTGRETLFSPGRHRTCCTRGVVRNKHEAED